MGLDWCLVRTDDKDRPVAELLGALRVDPENEESMVWLDKVIEEHREQIRKGGPMVTQDSAYRIFWGRDRKEIAVDLAGTCLPASIPQEKIDELIAAGITTSHSPWTADYVSYRGKNVVYNRLLTDDLSREAYDDKEPHDMKRYADALEACIPQAEREFWQKHKAEVEKFHASPRTETTPWAHNDPEWERYFDVDTIIGAANWLRYWAQYPVKMVAWF